MIKIPMDQKNSSNNDQSFQTWIKTWSSTLKSMQGIQIFVGLAALAWADLIFDFRQSLAFSFFGSQKVFPEDLFLMLILLSSIVLLILGLGNIVRSVCKKGYSKSRSIMLTIIGSIAAGLSIPAIMFSSFFSIPDPSLFHGFDVLYAFVVVALVIIGASYVIEGIMGIKRKYPHLQMSHGHWHR
jgi:hypothetical protein